MKLGINALAAKTGSGLTYTRNFAAALKSLESDSKDEYIFFVPSETVKSHKIEAKNIKFVSCAFASRSLLFKLIWEQLAIPILARIYKIDCLYVPQNTCTFFLFKKQVMTLRNMEPFYFLNYKNSTCRNLRNYVLLFLTRLSLRICNRVILLSEDAKKTLTKNCGMDLQKTTVVYHGMSSDCALYGSSDNKETTESLFQEFNLTGKYLLMVASVVAYRNYMELLKSFNIINKEYDDKLKLFVVGSVLDKKYFREINKFISDEKLTRSVKFLGYITDRKKLKALYCNCEAFVFSSTTEGCSNTLIEAMACGCPMIVSNKSSIPETCRDAAVYFNPYDHEEMADKIIGVLQNDSYRQELKKKALSRADLFSWTKTVKETLKVIKQCCDA